MVGVVNTSDDVGRDNAENQNSVTGSERQCYVESDVEAGVGQNVCEWYKNKLLHRHSERNTGGG